MNHHQIERKDYKKQKDHKDPLSYYLEMLSRPNGSWLLLKSSEAAAALAVFLEYLNEVTAETGEDLTGILSFLSQMAKTKAHRQAILQALPPARLASFLNSQAPKVRRNTARLIGALARAYGEEDLLEAFSNRAGTDKETAAADLADESESSARRQQLIAALEQALQNEEIRLVRPACLLALGELKDAAFLQQYVIEKPRSEEEEKHYREETEALRLALDHCKADLGASKEEGSAGEFALCGEARYDCEFRFSPGFEEEIRMACRAALTDEDDPPAPKLSAPNRVRVTKGRLSVEGIDLPTLQKLRASLRMYQELLLPVRNRTSKEKRTPFIFDTIAAALSAAAGFAEEKISVAKQPHPKQSCPGQPHQTHPHSKMSFPGLPYRLELSAKTMEKLKGIPHGLLEKPEKPPRDRRELIRRMETYLSKISGGMLINSVSRYAIELRLEAASRGDHPGVKIYIKPFFLKEERFPYRMETIPASIHPANAAGMMAAARSFESKRQCRRILDPCCGSGTLLFERVLRDMVIPPLFRTEDREGQSVISSGASALELYGFDITPRAIRAAKTNEKGFESSIKNPAISQIAGDEPAAATIRQPGAAPATVRDAGTNPIIRSFLPKAHFHFAVADLTRLHFEEPFDEIYANLPFGNRVGTHEDNEPLYQALVAALPGWLAADGFACLYTMEGKLLEGLIRGASGLRLAAKRRVFAGGLEPWLYIVQPGVAKFAPHR